MTPSESWLMGKDWFGMGFGVGLVSGWLAGIVMMWKVWSDSDKRRGIR